MPSSRLLPAILLALGALGALSAPVAAQQDARGLAEGLIGGEAQGGPVTLVADRVEFDNATGTLTAAGSVEVYYGDRTLTASRVVYDTRADRVSAEGPIVLRTPDGASITADFVDLDARLKDGLIRGARALLDSGARLASVEGRRIDDRYNVLTRAVFSSCAVCPEDPTPLWRIRARRIVHDEKERVIHYDEATFEILGQPVAFLPYFSHPDPTLKRVSGILPPEVLQSSSFGLAVKLPYYHVLDDQSDITITPFVMSRDGLIMEGEFRRRFTRGGMWLNGSVGYDDYDGEESFRGHFFGEGLWRFDSGVRVGFSAELASDDGYLRRYEFTDDDRLETDLFANWSDAQGYGDLSFVRFQSLRDDEPYGKIPLVLPVFEGRRTFDESLAGGVLGLETSGYALLRTTGEDTAHLSFAADWERTFLHESGLTARTVAQARFDGWQTEDSREIDKDLLVRVAPLAALELRYPLIRRDAGGDAFSASPVSHVIEPVVQGVAAPYLDDRPLLPNEDSLLDEFDETNMFSLRRHTGWDGFEEGPRINVGLRYSRIADDGPRFSASLGRVFRSRAIDSFADTAGLNGRESDYVAAWSLEAPGRLKLSNRLRISDDWDVNRNEVYAAVDWKGLEVEAGYIFLAKDFEAPETRQEATVLARYALTPNWFVGAELRRDLEAGEWVRTGGSIGYANECVDISFFAGRKFTSTRDVPASTYFGLRARVWALGGDAEQAAVAGECAPVIR